MPTRWLFSLALLLATLTSAICVSPSLGAGIYDVYSCRLPDGSPAPIYGWTPFNTRMASAQDHCAVGGAFEAALDSSSVPNGTSAGWILQAPPDTRIAGYLIFRYARAGWDSTGGQRDYLSSYDDHDPHYLGGWGQEYCLAWMTKCGGFGSLTAPPLDPTNRLERVGLSLSKLTFQLICTAGWTMTVCPGATNRGELSLFQTRISLMDAFAPVIRSAPQRPVASPLTGTVAWSVHAEDRGSGLADAMVIVDGIPQLPTPVPSASCRSPYVDFRPCPREQEMLAELNTTVLSDGEHEVSISVRDAAGNETQTDSFIVTVNNVPSPGVANGAQATRFAKLEAQFDGGVGKLQRTVSYGAKTQVSGRLTAAGGGPITGASVVVTQRDRRRNSPAQEVARVSTGSDGTFTYKVPPGPSRRLSFSYTAFSLDPGAVASAEVDLAVRAAVTLNIAPRRVRNGTKAIFRGRLLGGPGRGDAVVTIYALASGARKRIPVETVAAHDNGRFSYTYRFRSIAGRVRFRFQAVVPRQSGYPYEAGRSEIEAVRGRP
jgi:hypothetical protein